MLVPFASRLGRRLWVKRRAAPPESKAGAGAGAYTHAGPAPRFGHPVTIKERNGLQNKKNWGMLVAGAVKDSLVVLVECKLAASTAAKLMWNMGKHWPVPS